MESQWDYYRRMRTRFPAQGVVVFRFNFNPAAYLHPEKRSEFSTVIPEPVWSIERVQGRLSDRILRQSQLFDCPVFAFPHWGWPLVLLPPHRLARLSLHLGALIHGAKIRESLSRTQVMLWKEKLGSDAYEFATSSASLLPVVKERDADLLMSEPEQSGYIFLQSAAADLPEPMRTRFFWKLPQRSGKSDFDPSQARKLIRSVLSTVEPEWHSFTLPLAH